MKIRILAISKKILVCALAFALCLSCIGCNKTPDGSSSTPSLIPENNDSSVPNETASTPENDDVSSIDSSSDTSSDNSSQNKPSASKPTSSSGSSNNTTTSTDKPNTSSKPTSSNEPTDSSKPVSSTPSSNTSSTPVTSPLIVSCWGDSLTEGMSISATRNYPAVLNNYLGKGYKVLNGGDGGEDSITIMARQGGVKIYTKDKITFNAGDVEVRIGNGSGNGFVTADGDVIRLTPPLGRDMPINDITIGSQKYQLVQKNFNWSGRTCEVYLKRTTNINKAVTIEKGAEVKLASASLPKTNHCDIYLMGGNGGYKNNVNTLIEQHKKMIAHRGNDNYLVLIPYWTASNATELFIKAFGDKAVDFRTPATNQEVLENELGITLSATDKAYIAKPDVPPCLRLNNDPNQGHLNEKGYQLLAKVAYEQGKKLGYWQ